MATKNFQSRGFEFDLSDLDLVPHDEHFGSVWEITIDWFWDYDQAITRDDSHEVAKEIAKCVEESEEEVLAAVDDFTARRIKEIEQGEHEQDNADYDEEKGEF